MISDHTLAKVLHFRAGGPFCGHGPSLNFGGASAGYLLQKLLIHVTALLSLNQSSPDQQPPMLTAISTTLTLSRFMILPFSYSSYR
jgi:hypothetical protein